LKTVPRQVASLPGWFVFALRALGIRLTAPAGLRPPAEDCDEVANKIEDRLTAAALGAKFGSSSLTVRAQSFAAKILEMVRLHRMLA
jgi:hypothetical protein